MKPAMRLLLTFRDKSRPHAPALAEAEIRVHDFRYYQEKLTGVPMFNRCSRLEFSLPLVPRTLHSELADVPQAWSHFDSALHRHAFSLRREGSREDAPLGEYLHFMTDNLAAEFQSRRENIVVTLKTHPLNGHFEDSVALKDGAWALHRPPSRPEPANAPAPAPIPAHALTA